MKHTIPSKLAKGDVVRVIAPARSLKILSEDTRLYADKYLTEILGLKVEFSKHSEDMDEFRSSSIQDRIDDLHEAFKDPSVKAILSVIGGYNSNQLLDHIDWELIASNPKILCGFSDITVLENAIFAKTGMVTYSGPHYTNFGQKIFDEYTAEYFKKCLFGTAPFDIAASEQWTDDEWFLDQDKRSPIKNSGFEILQSGSGEGTIIGGNLCSLNLLQGTPYMPKADNVILFIEDDEESYPEVFDRDLQSLLQSLTNTSIKGVVIGRFQQKSEMKLETLKKIIKTKAALANAPVIAGTDFGHTDPKITFPIGGKATLTCEANGAKITILEH